VERVKRGINNSDGQIENATQGPSDRVAEIMEDGIRKQKGGDVE